MLILAACSGGGSEPLDNRAADAGSGVAEVYGNDGSALPNGGADAEPGGVSPSINETEPNIVAPTPTPTPTPGAGGPELTQAQIEEQYSPAYDTCLATGDAAKGVTPAMAQCIADEIKVQDERLNAAYRSAMDKRDEAGKIALRDEERAWIKARDAECQGLAQGGSIDRIQIPSCVLDKTIRRRVKLQPMAG
ncbi:hypothetical protein NX02_23395 [Sphingomonas sanxanigenens DSM 19645 = NX02]|uniref:Lysozyme inhibitor LprI-like N-terminal domain-containing protein n=1 Tax=Sphingomonas sanxanigenens DSM 19645 = NX02 TaxID=1123269 RepID=W0AEF7_9SPHN|nr:hypothetical protein NX02_23395 [Sphingomonas sanxanigenens DSM 19645 = NX02]